MVYCGYTDILMVVIFITVLLLLIVFGLLFFLFLSNFEIVVISVKLFSSRFFRDMEIIVTVWNLLFLLIVLIIRRRVAIFSFSYINRIIVRNFILLYLSFVFRIVWLIINNNFYWIILGWDGLGVVSYLLIIFYINHERINNGIYTMFQNRVGDLFFVLFIVGILDLRIGTNLILKYGLISLVIGACVKRAQYPFNSWLLAAIRAPTPISSLVHSSTLVVAGVYVLLQFSYCLIDVLEVLKYLRVLTLVVRRIGLLIEFDIKKLIAYSTLRHVSLIMLMLRLKLFKVVYFHLNIHAIFKSTMFMCFGFVILASYHRQDKRLISLNRLNPLIKIMYYFSCLCLIGLPFLRGFFSKDFIIEKFIEVNNEFYLVVLLLMFLGIRVYYGIKLLNLINVYFPYRIVEKRYLGVIRVVCIILIMVFVINVYIRLMVSLSLEILSFKMMIYLFIVVFFLIRVLTNMNYKFNMYDKVKNMKEVWVLDVYRLDKFIYWNISLVIVYLNQLTNVKLFLLMNWWVLVFVVVIF